MKYLLLFVFIGLVQTDNPDPLRFSDEIQAYKNSDAVHPPPAGVYLFVGSSSIRMWKTLEKDFEGYPVLNRGFGGSQFTDALYFFEDIVMPYTPKKIIVYEGDNDIASGKTPKVVFRDFKKLIRMMQKELDNPEIAVISPKPSPSRWHLRDQYESLNLMMESYCENYENLTFIDVYNDMLNGLGRPDPRFFLSDSLHMNEAGYRLWQEKTLPFIKK